MTAKTRFVENDRDLMLALEEAKAFTENFTTIRVDFMIGAATAIPIRQELPNHISLHLTKPFGGFSKNDTRKFKILRRVGWSEKFPKEYLLLRNTSELKRKRR